LFVVFAASAVAGLTGFGFAIVSVPILMLLLPPKVVVPVVQLLSLGLQVVVAVEARKWIDLRRLWPLLLAGMAATPLGTYLLLVLDGPTLQILVGAAVVALALAMLAGLSVSVRHEKLACIPVGVASGALGGSTGMPGPPVILFLANLGLDKHSFRANLVLYFALTSLVAVISMAVGGLVTAGILGQWVVLLPVSMLGTWIGIRLARRVDQALFRQITLAVLVTIGGLAVASGLGMV
jgi:uncharacterized membrane protein YfcA